MKNNEDNFLYPSDQIITQLLKLYQSNSLNDAKKLALSITRDFPKYQLAWKVLGLVLMKTDSLNESLIPMQRSVELEPNDSNAYYNLGIIFLELDKLDDAELNFKKTINLKPDYIEAYNNLGITLQRKNKLDESKKIYENLIKLRPDFTEAYNSLAVTFDMLGDYRSAEANYKKTIKLDPNHFEAYVNLGILLSKVNRLDEAMKVFIKSNRINPQFEKSLQNITSLLTNFEPNQDFSHPLIIANKEIKKKYKNKNELISDDNVINFFKESVDIIKKHNLEIKTELSQVFRRNTINLNCDRHMSIFNKFNIIPKFCFGCFKVQIEPKNLLELMKLIVVFDEIKLKNNNLRKCMIEMRPEIDGYYKGLIYCSDLDEANEISELVKDIISKRIEQNIKVFVKRGCSEYPIAYPEYKKTIKSKLMKYNDSWNEIEQNFDSFNRKKKEPIITATIPGFSLQDVLIIRNWIDYAKGIKDPCVSTFDQNIIYSERIFKKAKLKFNKKLI